MLRPTALMSVPALLASSRADRGEAILDRDVSQDAIEKADVLIEALGWIRRFRDKVTVIKLGGSVMENDDRPAASAVRHRVHGNRRHAARRGARRRSGDQSGDGRRRPRAAIHPGPPLHRRRHAAKSSNRCWPTKPTKLIAERIEEFGGRAMPLNFRTTNVLFGERIAAERTTTGKPIDLGHVGHVTRVDRTTIDNLCYAGIVPVIPSMCLEPTTARS